MAKTFAELEQATEVAGTELLESFRDYAEGGWAVLGRVVNGIVDRASALTKEDLQECLRLADVGAETQLRVCDKQKTKEKESDEYRQVANHVRARLASLES